MPFCPARAVPTVGHGVLCLSQCIRYPWTHDVPTAFPQVTGGHRVRRRRAGA
ncbi:MULTISPECIES: DUF6193 family natural product biosynthesis protein [Streptomyces]|uniref:DUF6193 family natural product biosynthesis protein n=1 Tax=Streptomyces TaxID=1883 RepID=UPI001CC256DB|nr:DUF6193 family natural product biosynthesis protein [Streptomyces venezuelae]